MSTPRWITIESTDDFTKNEVGAKLHKFLNQHDVDTSFRTTEFSWNNLERRLSINFYDNRQKLLVARALQAEISHFVDEAFTRGNSIITNHGPDLYYLSPDHGTVTQEMFDKLDEFFPFPIFPDITIFIDVPPEKIFPFDPNSRDVSNLWKQRAAGLAEQYRQNFFKKINDDLDKCDRDGTQSRYHIVNGHQSMPLIINDCSLILSPYFDIEQ